MTTLCGQGGTGLVGKGTPNSAWGVRAGISERLTTELRLEGGRGAGLMKHLGMATQAEGSEHAKAI